MWYTVIIAVSSEWRSITSSLRQAYYYVPIRITGTSLTIKHKANNLILTIIAKMVESQHMGPTIAHVL